MKQGHGVAGQTARAEYDSLLLKKLVSFVTGQKELEEVTNGDDRAAFHQLPGIAQVIVIRPGKLS